MKAIHRFVVRATVALALTGTLLGAAACSDAASPTAPVQAPAAATHAIPLTLQDSLNANLITPQQFQLALLSLLDAVKPCLKDGYKNYTTTKGVAFKNVLECALYAAVGGKLVPIAPPPPVGPAIVSFTLDGTQNLCDAGQGINALFTAQFSGGTGTITSPGGAVVAVTSGVQAQVSGDASGDYTLTVTGGGTSVTNTIQPFGPAGSAIQGCPAPTGGFNRAPVTKGRITP